MISMSIALLCINPNIYTFQNNRNIYVLYEIMEFSSDNSFSPIAISVLNKLTSKIDP